MKKSLEIRWRRWWVVLGAAVCVANSRAEKIPAGTGSDGVEGWRPVVSSGVTIQADTAGKDGAASFTFAQTSSERRFVAWETKLTQKLAAPKSLALRSRLKLTQGAGVRLAVVLYDAEGNAWYAAGAEPLTADSSEERISLLTPGPAGFSANPGAALSWDKIDHVWIGLICEPGTRGTLKISAAHFTDESYHPSRPLKMTVTDASRWTVSQDPAVKSALTIANEGGESWMRYSFTLPGGRHMYAIPALASSGADLEGFRSLRFTFRAKLPGGLPGMLISLQERDGSQYYMEPLLAPSAEWKSLSIPINAFRLAPWSKDENGTLDLNSIGSVMIGTHGTSGGSGGSGVIEVKEVEFTP